MAALAAQWRHRGVLAALGGMAALRGGRAPGFVPKFRPPEFSHCEKSSHERDWIFGPKNPVTPRRPGGEPGRIFFLAGRPAGVVTGFFFAGGGVTGLFFRGARRRGVVTGFFFAGAGG